ncbi:MAG: hypothetical protein METHAR1v1_550002 [Methanothrix sp.]|nr:MAG: hypothetical protein METHAR1v1_550002 [Methanothrix sp.]
MWRGRWSGLDRGAGADRPRRRQRGAAAGEGGGTVRRAARTRPVEMGSGIAQRAEGRSEQDNGAAERAA